MLRDPLWREKIRFGGWLLLLVPFVGWPAVLGYRKTLITRLRLGQSPVLPEWRGNVSTHFFEGLRALAIIFAHYVPLYVALWLLLLSRGFEPSSGYFYAVLFFLLFPIFSPLAFPVAVIFAGTQLAILSPHECFVFLASYACMTFLIPAGFLQVSLSGRYRSAFCFQRSLPWLIKNFGSYCRAWYLSSLMSLCGHFAIPFSPWGVVWCYLGIIYCFNRLLPDDSRATSWYTKMQGNSRIQALPTAPMISVVSLGAAPGTHEMEEARGLALGPIVVPLPKILTQTA